MKLSRFDQARVTKIFNDAYQNKLPGAFGRSAYKSGTLVSENEFCSGYHTNDSLFLVYMMESDRLKIYVETVNKKDLNVMKITINRYFDQVTDLLKANGLKWSKPEATITLEECPVFGFIQTKKERLNEMWLDQKEKLFIAPIASLLASYLALKVNILPADDIIKDMKKAVILTTESYIGVIIGFIVAVLLIGNKKVFTFNF